ncbi:hypothetical protein B7463_g11553, partial [Scytalidium lignicola]
MRSNTQWMETTKRCHTIRRRSIADSDAGSHSAAQTAATANKRSSFQKSLLVKNQRPLLPAYMESTVQKVAPQNVHSEPPSIQALDCFGYSNVNENNALGFYKKLVHSDTGFNQNAQKKHNGEMRLAPGVLEKYLHLLRLLPSRFYVDALVAIFFDEVGWQYSLVDYNIFADRLNVFYKSTYDKVVKNQSVLPESLCFPSLLFQIFALALQFLPSDYNRSLDALYMGSSFEYLAGEYSDTGDAVSALFKKDEMNFVSVQAAFLRVCWLKNEGRVTESWHTLGRVIMDAKEIGLHRLDEKVDAGDSDVTCSQLWAMEDRRRLWLNIFLWDSEMGIVLGKPLNVNLRDCLTSPPVDVKVTENLKTTAPFPRGEFDKPTSLTLRLIEYRLQINLPKVRELESEGPFPKDYTKVQLLHQEALNYMDTLPALYRFVNPDKSFDIECPWLAAQREYLHTVAWYFILALHKPYTFTIPESRKEIMRAGIEILQAQKRNFECLKEQHYKLFTLTYLTVEAAVAILAVLIAYPDDNGEPGKEAFHCIRDSITRLRITHEKKNALAGIAADVIQVLLNRVETARIFSISGLENTSFVVNPSPKSNSTTLSESMVGQDSSPHNVQDVGYENSMASSSNFSSSSLSLLNLQDTPFSDGNLSSSNYQDTSPQDNFLSAMDIGMDSTATNNGNLFAPLQPIADLMFHDLAPAFDVGSVGMQNPNMQTVGQGFENNSADELQQQFTGNFAENSLWGFMNQGL